MEPNLWGQEIDVLQKMDVYWNTIQQWLVAMPRWQGMEEEVAAEVAQPPAACRARRTRARPGFPGTAG